ncbi:MAG: acylphosphatase [Chloroflexota bacterium]
MSNCAASASSTVASSFGSCVSDRAQEANRLNLTGWVANQPDGTVKVVAEGDKSNLDNLLDFLHNGPPAARVENVKTTWSDAEGAYTEFRVRY